jgi:arylsulfatase A-like enzyme
MEGGSTDDRGRPPRPHGLSDVEFAGGDRPFRRAVAATLLAVVGCAIAFATMPSEPASSSDAGRVNVLLVITDDQPWDSLPVTSGPPAMPWLEARMADPTDHWVRFANASANVPLCCPARASILTGRYAHHTGVEGNLDGADFDESDTLATRLDDAGYQTAFIGKYLNGYPWGRGPYVPAGWDRFLAKRNLDLSTTYAGYPFVDQAVPLVAGSTRHAYATSFLAGEASAFLQGASRDRPWFLVFAPSAPHEPWTPAPADAGSFAGAAISTPSRSELNDVRGKPAWIRSLPEIDEAIAESLDVQRRRMLETLGAVDRAIRSLVAEVEARGESDRTMIVILSDNGYSFGEHRWVGKRCPYRACVRIPLVVRTPLADSGVIGEAVSNVDLAPTIFDLANVPGLGEMDGVSLRPLLDDRANGGIGRNAVLVEWAGDDDVPSWRGVRTEAFSYVEHADGTVELYDLSGELGQSDPAERQNRSNRRAYADVANELSALLADLAA